MVKALPLEVSRMRGMWKEESPQLLDCRRLVWSDIAPLANSRINAQKTWEKKTTKNMVCCRGGRLL